MKTWLDISPNSDFSIHNLPFGIFSVDGSPKRIGMAIGEVVIDLVRALELGVITDNTLTIAKLENEYLNDFIALGKNVTQSVRMEVQKSLCDDQSPLKNSSALISMGDVTMHLPVKIGDYTDFYSSIEHATNVGKMFRDPENALLPNWKHLPVGYHGRSSSIIVSGTDIHRPKGQTKPPEGNPVYGPSSRMDFELEMGFIIGKATQLGDQITTENAMDHIFGMVLFNDWSARDIQKWEYVPLGPFLGKSFASSISPWVVTMEALEPFQVDGPTQNPPVLDYLSSDAKNYDINLTVEIETPKERIHSCFNIEF